MGSGGHNKRGDEEKRRAGTYRPSRSEEAYADHAASKILAFPKLRDIPEPEMPLGEFARRKYDEFTRGLLDADRLNTHTRALAEQVSIMLGDQYDRLAGGKPVPAYLTKEITKVLGILKVADDARNIATPSRENRFARFGLPRRLRTASSKV